MSGFGEYPVTKSLRGSKTLLGNDTSEYQATSYTGVDIPDLTSSPEVTLDQTNMDFAEVIPLNEGYVDTNTILPEPTVDTNVDFNIDTNDFVSNDFNLDNQYTENIGETFDVNEYQATETPSLDVNELVENVDTTDLGINVEDYTNTDFNFENPTVDTGLNFDTTPTYDDTTNYEVNTDFGEYASSSNYDTTPIVDTTPTYDATPIVDTTATYDITPTYDTTPIVDTTDTYDITPTYDTTPIVDTTATYDATPIVDTTYNVGSSTSSFGEYQTTLKPIYRPPIVSGGYKTSSTTNYGSTYGEYQTSNYNLGATTTSYTQPYQTYSAPAIKTRPKKIVYIPKIKKVYIPKKKYVTTRKSYATTYSTPVTYSTIPKVKYIPMVASRLVTKPYLSTYSAGRSVKRPSYVQMSLVPGQNKIIQSSLYGKRTYIARKLWVWKLILNNI